MDNTAEIGIAALALKGSEEMKDLDNQVMT